jgi:CO/xanthine dehydrogenase Mo-binding subunit
MSTTVVGQSLHRIDGYEKVTGEAIYTGDFKLPGMVYCKVLRSPFAHARIRQMNTRTAESLTGVLAVLTGENLHLHATSVYYGKYLCDQPILAAKKVRYEGDIVAAVAATEEAIAEEALNQIDIEYDVLPTVETLEDALKPEATLVHDEFREFPKPVYGRGASYILHENSNIYHHFRYEQGNLGHALEDSDFVFEDQFFFPGGHHCAMEPHVSLANFDGRKLSVWTGVQVPFSLREEIARILGIALNDVRIVVPYVGGGYGGGRGVISSIIAAVLSRMLRRPVRVAFAADDSFKSFCQPRAKITIKTGLKSDGTFLARQSEVYLISGAYAHSMPNEVFKTGYWVRGPYRIPHVRSDSFGVYTTTVPTTALRGFGGQQVAFAYESHLDMIADRLKIDPLELRMKNLLDKGEEYYPGDTPMDCDLKKALRQVADAIQWEKRNDVTNESAGKCFGKGIACAVKDAGGTNKPAYAMVKIAYDGSLLLFSGSVELGQGVRTALLQIVAQEFSVGLEKVRIAQLDTEHTPYDRGTNSTSSILVMGQAVQKAAQDARTQLLSAAAMLLETPISELEVHDGKIVSKSGELSFREILRRHSGDAQAEIIGNGFFKVPSKKEAPLGCPLLAWEIGVAGAEVEVDTMTGEVKIAKYVSLGDAGKMINPILCRGQQEGAVVFGMGQTLFEELSFEDGKLLNQNLVEYRVPKFRDLPESFVMITLEEGGGPGPYGSKGMGDGGVLPVSAAVCNAVYDATGVRMNEVPLKGQRVWRVLRDHDSRSET